MHHCTNISGPSLSGEISQQNTNLGACKSVNVAEKTEVSTTDCAESNKISAEPNIIEQNEHHNKSQLTNNNSIPTQDDLNLNDSSSVGNKPCESTVKFVKCSSQQSNDSVLYDPKNKSTESALSSDKIGVQIVKENKVSRQSANTVKGAQKTGTKYDISGQVRTESEFN